MQAKDIFYSLYGNAPAHWPRFARLLKQSAAKQAGQQKPAPSQQDAVLITYGGQFYGEGQSPLALFSQFVEEHLNGSFSLLHFLPFYPYSSDDGFSVTDYTAIDPALGSWKDVAALGQRRRLMFDFVCNHVSAESAWAKGYLAGDSAFANFFMEKQPGADYTGVTRPRTSPLFTPYDTHTGKKWLWTTFGEDQLDLNYANPEVLYQMLRILLLYVERGAGWIRLDAVGFMWKEPGTSCIHLQQTHDIIRFLRAVLDEVAPGTQLITETNVPQADNLSYFGAGDESNMVYQFPLPLLTVYSFYKQSAELLTRWAEALPPPPYPGNTYFNFLASHDGIGVNPVRGIIPDEEIDALVWHLQQDAGALVSYKALPDGGKAPYEVNVSYLSALRGTDDLDNGIRRHICAHAIIMAQRGVPAVYIHSLLGSQNDTDGAEKSGIPRRINREKFRYEAISAELNEPASPRRRVMDEIKALLHARANCTAFHPEAGQTILRLDHRVFALTRTAADGTTATCLHNLSGDTISLQTPFGSGAYDLLREQQVGKELALPPYGYCWLQKIP